MPSDAKSEGFLFLLFFYILKNMKIKRLFTKKGESPYQNLKFVKRTCEIKNPDGSVAFYADDVSVPESWSQVATEVLVQKYFLTSICLHACA